MVSINCMTYNHVYYIEDAMNGFCMQDSVLISKFCIGKIGHFNKREKEKSSAHDC